MSSSQEHEDSLPNTGADYEKPKAFLGIRHLQVLMLSLGNAFLFSVRVNMAMAIVAMTSSEHENSFAWSIKTQSVILSSFFWGYILLQIPGGEMAAKFGGNVLVALAVGINSAITLLIPLGTYFGGWQLLCVCRVAQGLSQGFLYPATHNLIAKWIPLEERSRMSAFIYAGGQIGTAAQNLFSGYIAYNWGWSAIFYVNAAFGVIWTVFYAFLGAASPQSSTLIGAEERYYIQKSLGQLALPKKLATPWKSIMTSSAFLSVIVGQAGFHWGHWTLQTEMPSYFKSVLGVDIKKNGVLTALPYLAMYLASFPVGAMSDYMEKHKWVDLTMNRKIFNTISCVGAAVSLLALTYAPANNLTVAVVLLTVTVGLTAGHYAGYVLSHIDMAPNFAGTMMGISNGLSNIVSIIAPLAAGAILKDEGNPPDWHRVFYIAAVIYIVTNFVFVLFATSERQPWNDGPDEKQDTCERQLEK